MARSRVTRRAARAALGAAFALALSAYGGSWSLPGSASSSVRTATGGTQRQALAARYLAIAEAGNRRLEVDFDSLEDRDANNLTRARADLRDAAATERLFDRRLRAIRFPPATERVARDLYRINQRRATLTAAAAAASSLHLLHSYEPVLDAANAPVERDVAAIRRSLGLPPPDTS
jgi:hypothetical protein